MELFTEIYSAYYNVTAEILSQVEISKQDMEILIRKKAFSESILYLMPKLTESWNLLEKSKEGIFKSKLKNIPKMPMTLLEKRWIKSLLLDERIKLFLKDTDIENLNRKLKNIEPLFKSDTFYYFDRTSQGDNFSNLEYISIFRKILKSIESKSFVILNSKSVLPLKLEYSNMENQFRLYFLYQNRVDIISVKDINTFEITREKYQETINLEDIHKFNRCDTPIVLEIYPQRNALERFMMEFAKYEKHTEFNQESKICTAKIWYNKSNQSEIINQILSFGCTIKVISPNNIIEEIKSRVDLQFKMLCNF